MKGISVNMKLICLALVVLAFADCADDATCRVVYLNPINDLDVLDEGYDNLREMFKTYTIAGISKISFMQVAKEYSRNRCRSGNTFGFFNKPAKAWVDVGCKADFRICSGTVTTTVTCDKKKFIYYIKTPYCYAGGIIRNISLIEQRSKSPCTEGYSYWAESKIISVAHGCRGVFRVVIA